METEFRYQLDKSSTKYKCPACERMSLVRYIDTSTRSLLPERFGRCDHEVHCKYHLNPYRSEFKKEEATFIKREAPVAPVSYIPVEVLKTLLTGYDINCFINNLRYNLTYPFTKQDIEAVISQYYLGTITNGAAAGMVTFPFIDIEKRIRAIQCKEFDITNHTVNTTFIHSLAKWNYLNSNKQLPDWLEEYLKNQKFVTCLFGEHLLQKYPRNPVGLVEAPKTAVIATLYYGFPDNPKNMIWLSTYNLPAFNYEKCKVLKRRRVFVFPDLSPDGSTFKKWSQTAIEIGLKMPDTLFKVSDYLEKNADEENRRKASDIADFLVKQDWREFRPQIPKSGESGKSDGQNKTFIFSKTDSKEELISKVNSTKTDLSSERITPITHGSASNEVTELEQFFLTATLPVGTVQLDQATRIIDLSKFIKCELSIIKSQSGNSRYLPYLERLRALKSILSN